MLYTLFFSVVNRNTDSKIVQKAKIKKLKKPKQNKIKAAS